MERFGRATSGWRRIPNCKVSGGGAVWSVVHCTYKNLDDLIQWPAENTPVYHRPANVKRTKPQGLHDVTRIHWAEHRAIPRTASFKAKCLSELQWNQSVTLDIPLSQHTCSSPPNPKIWNPKRPKDVQLKGLSTPKESGCNAAQDFAQIDRALSPRGAG